MRAEDKNMEYQILEAAEKLFLEQGFAKTTTGQIAKLAGCNQALVHYYYRTKDNLFEKIFEEKVKLLVTNILNVDTTATTLEEKVKKMISMHFDFLKQNPRLFPFIINEILSNPARLQSLVSKLQQYPQAVLAKLEADLNREIEKGTIRPISVVDLILTAGSLNVVPFVIMPVIQQVSNLSEKDVLEILEHRKQEVIETVLSRLRK